MNVTDKIGMAVVEADSELDSVKNRLVQQATWLRDNMTNMLRKLETEGVGANINSLGEVQSLGHEVDRLCALFSQQREHAKMLRRLQGSVSP